MPLANARTYGSCSPKDAQPNPRLSGNLNSPLLATENSNSDSAPKFQQLQQAQSGMSAPSPRTSGMRSPRGATTPMTRVKRLASGVAMRAQQQEYQSILTDTPMEEFSNSLHAQSSNTSLPQPSQIGAQEEIIIREAEIFDTFREMEFRKLRREVKGKYKERGRARQMWLFVFVALFLGVGVLSWQSQDENTASVELQLVLARDNAWMTALLLFGSLCSLIVVWKVLQVIRWCLYWIVVCMLILVIATRRPLAAISLLNPDCPKGSTYDTKACTDALHPCRHTVDKVVTCQSAMDVEVKAAVIILLFNLEALTILCWVIYVCIYPALVRKGKIDLRKLRHPRKDTSSDQAAYKFRTGFLFGKKARCCYEGEVDEEGRPHGYGEWVDNSYHGESLRGLWQRGKPLGPFRSREYGSGYSFMSVRVGFVSCRQDEWQASSFIPHNGPVNVGVASVECSISGKFFRSFPCCSLVIGPSIPEHVPVADAADVDLLQRTGSFVRRQQLCWVNWLLAHMPHLQDHEPVTFVSIALDPRRGLIISGHQPLDRGCRTKVEITAERENVARAHDESALRLQAALEEEKGERSTENVHSGTQSVASITHPALPRPGGEDGILTAPAGSGAQGEDFQVSFNTHPSGDASSSEQNPSRVRRYRTSRTSFPQTESATGGYALCVHNWVPSNLASHNRWEALLFFPGYNTSLEATLQRLGQLLCLGDFPAHIKPFVFSYPAGQILTYYAARNVGAESDATMNALRYTLDGFRMAGCRRLHIMSHSMGARVLMKGLNLFREFCTQSDVEEVRVPGEMELSTITMLNPDYALKDFKEEFTFMRSICDVVTMYLDAGDKALRWLERVERNWCSPKAWFRKAERSLGRSVFSLYEGNERKVIRSQCRWLDLDVVDTTWMENNVHSVRHNYFNINRELVEDLRDVIVTGRRAASRHRLLLREGNVYSFLVAPAYVVNP